MNTRSLLCAVVLVATLAVAGCVEGHRSGYTNGYNGYYGFRHYDGGLYDHRRAHSHSHYEQERRHRYEQDRRRAQSNCPKRDTRWYQPWRSSHSC